MLLIPSEGSNWGPLVLKSVSLTTEPNLTQFMAALAYTTAFCALVWMNIDTFRLIKIYFEVPEDSAFISSKCSFDRC